MFEAEGLTREGDAILKHLDFKARCVKGSDPMTHEAEKLTRAGDAILERLGFEAEKWHPQPSPIPNQISILTESGTSNIL